MRWRLTLTNGLPRRVVFIRCELIVLDMMTRGQTVQSKEEKVGSYRGGKEVWFNLRQSPAQELCRLSTRDI